MPVALLKPELFHLSSFAWLIHKNELLLLSRDHVQWSLWNSNCPFRLVHQCQCQCRDLRKELFFKENSTNSVLNAFGTPEIGRVLFLVSQEMQKKRYLQTPGLSLCSSSIHPDGRLKHQSSLQWHGK